MILSEFSRQTYNIESILYVKEIDENNSIEQYYCPNITKIFVRSNIDNSGLTSLEFSFYFSFFFDSIGILVFFVFYYREEWNILIELAEDERECMWNGDFMDD